MPTGTKSIQKDTPQLLMASLMLLPQPKIPSLNYCCYSHTALRNFGYHELLEHVLFLFGHAPGQALLQQPLPQEPVAGTFAPERCFTQKLVQHARPITAATIAILVRLSLYCYTISVS